MQDINRTGESKAVLDRDLLARQERWLLKQFRSLGQTAIKVTSDINREDKGLASVCWHVSGDSQKALFGKTIVSGVCPVPFKMLLSQLSYSEGDKWDPARLRSSFLRLKDWGIFNTVQLVSTASPDNPFVRDILIKLHEDQPIEGRMRAGLELEYVKQYSTASGLAYRVGGTVMAKNITNSGDVFRIDADIARAHREVVACYNRPLSLQIPARMVMNGYMVKHNQPGYVGSRKNIYTIHRLGGSIGLFVKEAHYDIGLNIGAEWAETNFDSDVASTKEAQKRLANAINFEYQLLGKRLPYFYFENTFFVDRLDNKLDPRSGCFALFAIKGVYPLQHLIADQSCFVRVLLEQACFFPIKSFVGALRVRLGHIFNGWLPAIIPTDRFYLGGGHSLRGYETDLAPPLGLFINDCGLQYVVPRGGKSMVNISAEARFDITSQVGIVLFQDAGQLAGDKLADFRVKNMLFSSGFGLRYKTPIGPLRFDIGWCWQKTDESDNAYAWVLNFGQAF